MLAGQPSVRGASRVSEPRGGSGSGCGCNKWEADWAGLETQWSVSQMPATPEQTRAPWSACPHRITSELSDDIWWPVTSCDDLWWNLLLCDCDDESLMWWHVTCDAWQLWGSVTGARDRLMRQQRQTIHNLQSRNKFKSIQIYISAIPMLPAPLEIWRRFEFTQLDPDFAAIVLI